MMTRTPKLSRDRVVFSSYALFLLLGILIVPLKIAEILQLCASQHFNSTSMLRWIAQIPNSAPLNYFVQLPFAAIFGHSRFGGRLDTLLFALGSCYFFLGLAKRIHLQQRYFVLAAFMLVPLHFQAASEGLPLEQALFFLLLATDQFFRLLERPSVPRAIVYTVLLTLCVYTDRYSYTPAFGYLLSLFRFVNRAQERRALWYVLPATILPSVLFLPYFVWAQPQVSAYWLTSPPAASRYLAYLNDLRRFAGEDWIAFVLIPLLLGGIVAGAWSTFRPAIPAISKRIFLFCLFGGIVSTLAAVIIADFWLGDVFSPNQLLWTMPAAIVLMFAALEWLAKQKFVRALAMLLAALVIALCILGDVAHLSHRTENQQALAALVQPELTGNSCVVFVSQRLSKPLFTLFDPGLEKRECLDFFHRRVVLASHPYVLTAQQSDAENFFHALNFAERKRISAGGGQIVVMDQTR